MDIDSVIQSHFSQPLNHGGELNKAAKKYNRPISDWLDLSTGISPFSYPVNNISQNIWQRLPEMSPEFIEATNQYYQTDKWVVCAGTQAGIQVIPKLWHELLDGSSNKRIDVWVPEVGYKEHEKSWQDHSLSQTNHLNVIHRYCRLPSSKELTDNCVVVVINPNNPTGHFYEPDILIELAESVKRFNGLLIIDEAFIDSEKEKSIFPLLTLMKNIIVMRSLGKFFGLAGIRVGFILSNSDWLDRFRNTFGLWSVTGPSLAIAKQALADVNWQSHQIIKLNQQSNYLARLLKQYTGITSIGTNLFQTLLLHNAETIYEELCKQGILVRLCDEKNALRFGISDDAGYLRLIKSLTPLFK